MKYLSRIISLIIILGSIGLVVAAQTSSGRRAFVVSGTIVDDEGLPAMGATVALDGPSGTKGGVIADDKGRFSISVPPGGTIRVSYLGYADQTRIISGDISDWRVVLIPDENFIEDAVVVGYGVQKKESVVGAISTVSADQISRTGTNKLSTALTGKVSGLSATTLNGAPGEGETTLMLRGLSTFKAGNNSPLILVDGIERSMNDVNPNEVQTISVLKDASATAIFGSKGANGVILITTKQGSEGRPKMNVKVEYGLKSALNLPEHIPSVTTVEMANVAMRNDRSFTSLYSDDVIRQYRDQTNPWRYPDVDWYQEILNRFARTYNASMSIRGGSKHVTYYGGVNYYHDGSLVKEFVEGNRYSSDKINYRLNLNASFTKTTTLSLRLTGTTTINSTPSVGNTGQLFNEIYMASGSVYPAYFPESIFELYPDPNYPDASGIRLASNAGQTFENPMRHLLYSTWSQTTNHRLGTDAVLTQNLDFITKGLSAKATLSLTSVYVRTSEEASQNVPQWSIDWNRVDQGIADVWNSTSTNVSEVYVTPPLAITQETTGSNINFITYLEGALNYNRKFNKHHVTALALYNQRQFNSGSSSPRRNQSLVGRVTYNYRDTYLFETNAGITGSERFAPSYRYGFFPSVAVGYVLSKEKFWKKALPWWSNLKFRFSWGLVGDDSATSGQYLYYTTYKLVDYSNYGKHYVEGAAANEGARWETAEKKDLGIEMGFFKNALTVNVDLFDEYRYDMLMEPVITPLIGVSFNEINAGAMKRHGIDIDINYKKVDKRSGFFYQTGVLVGLNENRIVKYADIPYDPEYRKVAGTPLLSQRSGSTLVDDDYFQNINQIHGYPAYTSQWNTLVPGSFKFLDYYGDGVITDKDLHVIRGSSYPPCTYSLNLELGYKGLTLRMVGTGTIGKYIQFKRSYIVPFMSGDLSVHKAILDYWTPTNRNAAVPALSYDDLMYSWAGGTQNYPGYNLALEGYTWRKSDYFNLSEIYLSYTFNGKKLQQRMGIDALTLCLTCNNAFIWTGLIEGNPQMHNTATSYYPLMRTTQLGVNVSF